MTALGARRAGPGSPVSVVVPCFNHGAFLVECLESILAQTVPPHEVIVVDDGSTDAHTLSLLAEVDAVGRARVVRQANQGPSAARNRGIGLAACDLVLPVDADNRLAPNAIAAMRETLLAAPDRVRFAYPHQQFFGNRTDLAVMPAFNLYLLLHRNFCDTGSLIDRSVFEAGCAYREDIGLGHEDWDFFLTVAERGFVGIPCHENVLQVRKHGFTRSDLVNHQFGSFVDEIRLLHPGLFEPQNLMAVKQEWAPAVSLVLDRSVASVAAALDHQTFQDFEVVGAPRTAGRFSANGGTAPDRRAVDTVGTGAMAGMVAAARGRWVLVWAGSHPPPLADPAFVEKGARLAQHLPGTAAVGLAVRSEPGGHGWRPAGDQGADDCSGVLVAAEVAQAVLPTIDAGGPDDLASRLLDAVASAGRTAPRWRTFPPSATAALSPAAEPAPATRPRPVAPAAGEPLPVAAGGAPESDPVAAESAGLERQFRQRRATPLSFGHEAVTRLPRTPLGTTCDAWSALHQRAWSDWAPPHTELLGFVVDPAASRWTLLVGDVPEATRIGRVYTQPFPGTVSLWRRTDPLTAENSYWLGETHDGGLFETLGFLSTAHLPGMTSITEAVPARLARERSRLGGRPLPDFVLGGDVVGAFLEPVTPPPSSLDPDGVPATHTCWAVYEAVTPDGRVSYSAHPDAPAVAAGPRLPSARQVARLGPPTAGSERLHEVVHRVSGARMYLTEPRDAGDAFVVSGVLGSFAPPVTPGTVPIVRVSPATPESHPGGPDPGQRLGVADSALLADGRYHAEGVMGHVLPPSAEQRPLYRWRHRGRRDWRYRLAEGLAADGAHEWTFETTVGLAFPPTDDRPGLVNLVELAAPHAGAVTYRCVRDAELAHLDVRRVVARLHERGGPGLAPLFEATGGDDGVLYGLAPGEAPAEGLPPAAVVAHVGIAAPPHAGYRAVEEAAGIRLLRLQENDAVVVEGVVADSPGPGLLALVGTPARTDGLHVAAPGEDVPPTAEVVGYVSATAFPFCLPLYEVAVPGRSGPVLATAVDGPGAGRNQVRRAVGFLGSRGDHTVGRVAGGPLPAVPDARLTVARVVRAGLRRLPPPTRARLAAMRHEVERAQRAARRRAGGGARLLGPRRGGR